MQVLVALAFAHGVTFNHAAAPLRVLIPELAEAAGLELAVTPELEWRVLYVRVANAKQSDLLTEIERASGGTWIPKPNGRLVLAGRDTSSDSLARMRDALSTKGTPSTNINGRFRKAVIDALGTDFLSRIPDKKTLTFSTDPVGRQRPMPTMEEGVLSEMLARGEEYNIEAD